MAETRVAMGFTLACAKEIADYYKVGPSAVSNWIARFDDFPQPIYQYGNVKIWLWKEIRDWKASH